MNSAQVREQIRSEIARAEMRRQKTREAAEWIRHGAPGRALECLEVIIADFAREDLENSTDFQRYQRERELDAARATMTPMTAKQAAQYGVKVCTYPACDCPISVPPGTTPGPAVCPKL